ncbi:hypothetical protein AB0O91_12630 [Kitasatospora sp. NPDC089797]|uniref:DUF6630 family protein n=1 Tax=Kitasatospora sp. NPDC089797 TaxID=3155298 RepID=UPI003447D9EE
MTEAEALEQLVLTPGERAGGLTVDRVMFTMDWTGEEEPGELAAFLAGRLRAFGADPTGVDAEAEAVRREAENDPTLCRGDLPVRQLDRLAELLAEIGWALLVWDSGTDAYEVLVAPAGGPEPTALTYQGLPVRPWGSEPDTRLVSLDCPGCAEMRVWELSPTETLADEHCDCGAPLFDVEGRPLVPLHD